MSKIQTPLAEVKYAFITGEGRDNAMPGDAPRMEYTATVRVHKDSPELKIFKDKLEAAWADYTTIEPTAKGTLTFGRYSKCACIKQEFELGEPNDIDPETGEVRKIPTDYMHITFSTSTTTRRGVAKQMRIFANTQQGNTIVATDITDKLAVASWSVGQGSTAILHGSIWPNAMGGKAKLTVYLSAVQLGKLVKYEGDAIDVTAIDGCVVDLDDIPQIDEDEEPQVEV